jgi:hypothetical protein
LGLISWKDAFNFRSANDVGGSIVLEAQDNSRMVYGVNRNVLPGQLREEYGDAAFPYLERALETSPNRAVQLSCARQLINADRRAGFAIALRTVQQGDRMLADNLRHIVRERFPRLQGADDRALIDFLESRLK